MKPSTLSRKLFVRIAPTIIITILLIGGLAFRSADTEINQVYDAQLISNANVLWTLISDKLNEDDGKTPKKIVDIDLTVNNKQEFSDPDEDYADSRMFRVWEDGKITMYSDTALPKDIPKQPDGFSTVSYKDDDWRIYSLPISNKAASIEVGEKMDLRDGLVFNILFNLAFPLLFLIPIIGVLIWMGIASGLGTIRSLVEQIRKRSPDDLSHVDIQTMPKDLSPLGKSLNQLFTKLEHSFTAEKRFTDHAAHQLRTPLATLKLQLQMLAEAGSEEEKQVLIKELMQSNERAAKLVGMLLTSARLSHQPVSLDPVAIYPILASVMAELGLIATQKNIEMSLEGAENANVFADGALLKLMFSNLIENAIKYTPDGGAVKVTIEKFATNWKISIIDTGSGIPEAQRDLVFERFYRLDTPSAEGSGLGLAIVAEIVEKFSGSIALKTPISGAGLLVEVVLPAYI